MKPKIFSIIPATILVLMQCSCASVRPHRPISVYLHNSFDFSEIDKVSIGPIICNKQYGSICQGADKVILDALNRELEEISYPAITIEPPNVDPAPTNTYGISDTHISAVEASKGLATSPRMPDWVGLLGTEADRFVLVVSLEKLADHKTGRPYKHTSAALTGYLFDKKSRELLWEDCGRSEVLIGNLWVYVFRVSPRDVALKNATKDLIRRFPDRGPRQVASEEHLKSR